MRTARHESTSAHREPVGAGSEREHTPRGSAGARGGAPRGGTVRAAYGLVVAVALAACSSGGGTGTGTRSATTMSSTGASTGASGSGSVPGTSTTAPAPGAADGVPVCWSAPPDATGPVALTDVTMASGIESALTGMMVHAVAAGDVNADGFTDLFVGTFADRPETEYAVRGATGAAPDRLLLGSATGFHVDEKFPAMFGRTAGAAFADLDGDGDLDLVISRNPRPKTRSDAPSVVLRNDTGHFTQATVLDARRGGRSVGVLDYDGDGRLDLVLTEDKWTGGSSVLLHNDGDLRFSDATVAAGLPRGVYALGVSTVDLTGDRLPDLFFSDSNRLFVNTGGQFAEEAAPEFAWPVYGDEDDVAGVAAGDLNGDGRMDLVLGQHYNSTLDFGKRVPVRAYLNEGAGDGRKVRFRDITTAAGIPDLPTKAPHVEIVDLDADGRLDIVTSAASGGRPVVLMNRADPGQEPRFEPLTPVQPPGEPTYWVTGATMDADHDGRLELFLAEWYPQRSSLLLRQSGGSGHWLTVALPPATAIGSIVDVYAAGAAGDAGRRIGHTEVVASTGFGAGTEALARFGLGAATEVDLVVTDPGGRSRTYAGVRADALVRVGGGC